MLYICVCVCCICVGNSAGHVVVLHGLSTLTEACFWVGEVAVLVGYSWEEFFGLGSLFPTKVSGERDREVGLGSLFPGAALFFGGGWF